MLTLWVVLIIKMTYIISFDIDGTLLNDAKKVSAIDLNTLHKLKKQNILRIAATGRNYYSIQKVLNVDFPVDYIVFSSGAGIMNWATKKVIYCSHISKHDIEQTINMIMPHKLNFTVHLPIPNNHHILLYKNNPEPEDLIEYTLFYKDYLEPLDINNLPKLATQVIVLLNNHVNLYNKFSKQLKPLKTILTTSPINHKSMWMEVFNPNVSKSNGVNWIINYLKIKNPHVFAIGNDYNDIDLLNFAQSAFVVSNAPNILKQQFKTTTSNNNSGFSEAVKMLFNKE